MKMVAETLHDSGKWIESFCAPVRSFSYQEATPNHMSDDLNLFWLELTRACNLNCSHCYADSGPHFPVEGAMTLSDWQRLLHIGHSAVFEISNSQW